MLKLKWIRHSFRSTFFLEYQWDWYMLCVNVMRSAGLRVFLVLIENVFFHKCSTFIWNILQYQHRCSNKSSKHKVLLIMITLRKFAALVQIHHYSKSWDNLSFLPINMWYGALSIVWIFSIWLSVILCCSQLAKNSLILSTYYMVSSCINPS